MKKVLSLLLAALLVVSLAACGAKQADSAEKVEIPVADGSEIGSGETTFTAEVTDGDGQKITFTVRTDKKTVGEALQALGVLEGEEGPYGLYVKTVNGITADYASDGSYWAFYIDGAYADTGCDCTDVTDGAVYGFAVETM